MLWGLKKKMLLGVGEAPEWLACPEVIGFSLVMLLGQGASKAWVEPTYGVDSTK